MIPSIIRCVGALVCAAVAAIRSPVAQAQQGTIRLVLGHPAGASSDALTRCGPERLAMIMKADDDRWGPVIRASGFKPE